MRTILCIIPDYHTVTGGTKINNQVLDVLKSMPDVKVVLKNKQISVKKEHKKTSRKTPFFIKTIVYNFFYLRYREEAKNKDYIFTDSRLFARLPLLLLALKTTNSKTKFIITHHHFCFLEQQSLLKNKIYKFLEINFLKQADRILVFSDYTYNLALQNRIPKDKINLNVLGFEKGSANNNELTNDTKELLYIGTIEERKGLIYLLKAINSIPIDIKSKIKVNIVGNYDSESNYYNDLLSYIKANELDNVVKFYGWVSDEELNKLKNNALFFVFPSLYEGFGMVIGEAMIYGLPVVAFDNSAMPYIIKDNYNGLLARDKDYLDLADKITKLILDKDLRKRLSKGAIQTADSLNTTSDFKNGIYNSLKNYLL